MPDIKTLVKDMEETILGMKGWNEELSKAMGNNIASTAGKRFGVPQRPRSYLSFSSIGSSCKRKLWYKINEPSTSSKLAASDLLKFFYGDMIEELILTIAKISGHEVVGEQDRMYIGGLAGHRDAVIDGMTIDVKSASPASFKKFAEGKLREKDSFGYISQLSSYVYAAKDDPLVTNKTQGAFLVMDKVSGEITLDVHDFSEEIKQKEKEVESVKRMVKGGIPDRLEPEKTTYGNTQLCQDCFYCDFKKHCWPESRKFLYKGREKYLVDVVKEPKDIMEDLTW